MDVLQISLEGLDSRERNIFLHIACFFNGERVDYVKRILACCGLNPDIGIPLIIEKSLVTIRNQEIHMHEMLQELGKKIIQEQFPEEPGQWSRLWLYQDFHHVMITQTGTKNVKAIVLNQKEDVYSELSAEGLSIMKGLRLLILYHNKFSGSPNFLPNSLQYLLWHSYPFASLPQNFEPYGLVELDMPNSSIQRLWEGHKYLPSLKRVDLSNSKYLIETPNFERIPNLERLDLTGCTNLLQVHPSIGCLEKLAFLSLEGCSSLVSLDLGSESNLISLRVLHLSGCTKLEATPDFTGLSNLEYLDIDQCTSLTMVHVSLGDLSELRFLSLRHCTNLVSMPNRYTMTLTSLRTLDLYGCLELMNVPLLGQASLREENTYHIENASMNSYYQSLVFLNLGFCNISEVPDDIRQLMCLERLNLEANNFVSLPSSICSLSSLAYLNLSHCQELEFLYELPSTSSSSGGKYFETESGSRNHRSGLYALDLPKLRGWEFSRCQNLALSWLIRLVKQPCHFRCGFDIVIPGDTIPKWFSHQFDLRCPIRWMDSDMDDNWIGFAFCVAFEVNLSQAYYGHGRFDPHHPLYLSFETAYAEERFDMALSFDVGQLDGSKHVWLIYISRPHCHFVKNGAHITFKGCPDLMLKECGLRVVSMENIMAKEQELQREQQIESVEAGVDDQVYTETESLESSEEYGEGDQVDHLPFEYADESFSSISSEPKVGLPYNWFSEDVQEDERLKFQLPYNWLTTKEEENENMAATAKKNRLANMGLRE